nr:hypothetical protein [Tanacetum cinerariifolium]
MDRGFLSKKGSGGGKGVRENNKVVTAKDVVSQSVIDKRVVKKKQSSLVDISIPNVKNTGLRSYPPLPIHGYTPAGNTHGMSSYANVTGESSRKALNFRTLFTPRGNRMYVVVLVESIRAISERFANTAYGFFLGKWVAYPVVANYNPDVNLLKEDVGNVLVWVKIHGVPITAFSEDGLSAIATNLVFGHIREECPKNSGLGVAKNLKKPSQNLRGVRSGNKKNDVEPTKKFSNSNPFDVLNSVVNDVIWLPMRGLQIWLVKRPNVESSSTSTTLIVNKIGKFEKLIIDGKVTLVDDEGEPVKKVDHPVDHDSENEVASVDNDMARSMASEKVGFGTNSLLEQWRDTYENDDYDYDPYDDDMYEGQKNS